MCKWLALLVSCFFMVTLWLDTLATAILDDQISSRCDCPTFLDPHVRPALRCVRLGQRAAARVMLPELRVHARLLSANVPAAALLLPAMSAMSASCAAARRQRAGLLRAPPCNSSRTPAGRKPSLHGMNTDFVEGWVRRNAAERPRNVVPSALERLAFLNSAQGREIGNEWARLSEADEHHLSGLLDLVTSTGGLEVRRLEPSVPRRPAPCPGDAVLCWRASLHGGVATSGVPPSCPSQNTPPPCRWRRSGSG